MIVLQHPVNLLENRLIMKRIWEKYKKGRDIMLEDKLEYYQAKANFFSKKAEDSGGADYIALGKTISAIRAYDELEAEKSKYV